MNALMPSNQTNGMSLDLEMNSDLLDQLGWRSYWYELNDKLQKELDRTRKVRPLLPLLGDQSLDPDAIADFAVSTVSESPSDENGWGKRNILSIPTLPRLVSADISCRFRLSPDQLGNLEAARRLITMAGHQLALAEDAVLLLGDALRGSEGGVKKTYDAFLKLAIDRRNLNLEQQTEKLLQAPYKALTQRDPRSVLKAVLRGIKDLQENGQYGEYCALVAPDLYQQAYAPAEGDISSAPIYQILPRLREGGFGCSQMMSPGMGVMWSVGGDAIGVAVPREACVTFLTKDRDIYLSVQERIRLIVNQDRAVVPLRDPDGPSDDDGPVALIKMVQERVAVLLPTLVKEEEERLQQGQRTNGQTD